MNDDFASGIIVRDENQLSGYLYKKTKDGRWQRRWFETNGVYLTYYKSRKVEKLLAALSLPQVGEIKLLNEPGETGLFSIELNSRVYVLRAKSDDEANIWVEHLSKLRLKGDSSKNSKQFDNVAEEDDNVNLKKADEVKKAGFSARQSDWEKNPARKSCLCC